MAVSVSSRRTCATRILQTRSIPPFPRASRLAQRSGCSRRSIPGMGLGPDPSAQPAGRRASWPGASRRADRRRHAQEIPALPGLADAHRTVSEAFSDRRDGSGGGTRTPDPWIMIPLLYRLSYPAPRSRRQAEGAPLYAPPSPPVKHTARRRTPCRAPFRGHRPALARPCAGGGGRGQSPRSVCGRERRPARRRGVHAAPTARR